MPQKNHDNPGPNGSDTSSRADDAKTMTKKGEDKFRLPFQGHDETTIGMEIEMPILDRETGEIAPGAPRILRTCDDDGIDEVTAELMQSMLEIRSGVCANVEDLKRDLISRLRRVRNLAETLGYDFALLGTHPSARPNEHILFPDDRYRSAEDRMAWMIYHRVTFGLHVHIGAGSGDQAIGLINMLVQYLPHLLAASANSSFWQGVDTGLASVRAALYGMVPHAGVPLYFHKWKQFRNYCQLMRDCRTIKSHKDIKWDIRPRADYGTIEFRICDMPASLDHALGIAALIRALVISTKRLLEERPHLRKGDIRRQWIAVENKWLATRFGLDAMHIRTSAGKRRPLRHDLADLIERLKPVAEEAGDLQHLKRLTPLDSFETGAERQRRIYRDAGDWKAVIDDSIRRLKEDLKKHAPPEKDASPPTERKASAPSGPPPETRASAA